MNGFALFQALVLEPRKAFAELAERPRILMPLLLGVLATAGITLWFYHSVDAEWLVDSQLRASAAARQLSEAQIAERAKSATENPGRIATIATVGAAIGVVIAYLLVSVYYLLAGKVTNVQRSFGQWMAFTCWTSLPPLVLTVLAAAIALTSATSGQIAPGDIKALSLNALLFHKAAGDPGYALWTQVGVPEILSAWLGIVGVREWSRRSWVFATIFVLLPSAVILGIVALFAMGRS